MPHADTSHPEYPHHPVNSIDPVQLARICAAHETGEVRAERVIPVAMTLISATSRRLISGPKRSDFVRNRIQKIGEFVDRNTLAEG